MFNNVIIGVKDSEADRDAVRLATTLASPSAEVTLAHVQVVMDRPAPDSGGARYAADRRCALERLTALRDEAAIQAQVTCQQARSARDGLHHLARTRHADLLVIGATRQDELAREIIDDTRDVLDEAPCAVAVAPLGYSEHRAAMRKIGIAYDDSPESDEALNVARQIGKARGASVSVFHAVRARLPALSPGAPHDARDSTEKLGNVEACGDTVEDLLRYGRSVDLLVLGSRKHGPMSRLVHQSIAARLADDASSPLLVLSRTARR